MSRRKLVENNILISVYTVSPLWKILINMTAYNDILLIKALRIFYMNNSFYDIVAEISDAYLQHCIFFLWYLIIPLLLPTSNFYGDNCHLLVYSITNKREQRLKMRIIDNLSLLPAAIFVPFCGGRYFLLIYLFM